MPENNKKKRDFTPLHHALITIATMCVVAGLVWILHHAGICFRQPSQEDIVATNTLTHGCIIGAFLAVGFYLGREVAQAERRGDYPDRVKDKWYRGFYIKYWNLPSKHDFVVPLISAILFICIVYHIEQ